MNMQGLAQAVKSNYKKLDESEVVGRIMLITGKTFTASLKGTKMLQEQKLLGDLVPKESVGILEKMIEKNPNVLDLFERLELIPGKTNRIPPKPFTPVPKIVTKDVVKALDLGTF